MMSFYLDVLSSKFSSSSSDYSPFCTMWKLFCALMKILRVFWCNNMKNCLLSHIQVVSVSLSGYIWSLLITTLEQSWVKQSLLCLSLHLWHRPAGVQGFCDQRGGLEEDLPLVEQTQVRQHVTPQGLVVCIYEHAGSWPVSLQGHHLLSLNLVLVFGRGSWMLKKANIILTFRKEYLKMFW